MVQVIKIDPEFKGLIPESTSEEKAGLEKSILAEGCRDPLVLWRKEDVSADDILIDGHNRHEICRRHKIDFHIVTREFDNRDQAKIWIIKNQLGRRNLTPEQWSNLRGMRYDLEKREVGQPKKELAQNEPISTAKKIAKETGVSAATIKRDAEFAKALESMDPELKERVLAGKSGLAKKQVIAWPKMSEEERKKALADAAGKKIIRKMKKGLKKDLGKQISGDAPVTKRSGIGMMIAKMAVRRLSEIPKNDADREEAFDYVQTWINDHR